MKWRTTIGIAFLALALGGGEVASAGAASRHSFLVPPPKLPQLTLNDMGGGRENLRSLRGHPLFVNLWAAWCAPCRAEIPDLERLYEANHEAGFEVIGINQGDSKEVVQKFLRQIPVTYRVLLDPNCSVSEWYGFNQLPITLVVNKDGALVHTVVGMMSMQQMQEELQQARTATP